MRRTIDEGDFVSVHFHGAKTTLCGQARVDHKPCATGDSWVIFQLPNGPVHYISEGVTLTKLEDGPRAEAF